MKKLPWVLVVLFCIPVVLTAAAGMYYQSQERARLAFLAERQQTPPPRAVASSTHFEFGEIEPGRLYECRFEIRNEGGRTLKLEQRREIEDVLVSIKNEKVRSGQATPIAVLYETTPATGSFQRDVTIATNDPEQPEIAFSISGHVESSLSFDDSAVNAGDVLPHQPGSVESVLYSQTWDDLHIREVKTSYDGIQWSEEPVASQDLLARHARSAKRLKIELPSGLNHGPLNEWLEVTASANPEGGDTQTRRLQLQGRVLRRLAVYGDVEFTGVITLGKAVEGEAKRVRLRLKVRDEDPVLQPKHLKVSPDFLQVKVQPVDPQQPEGGNYLLEVGVPADAPPCNYLGGVNPLGQLHLEFEHPRIPELDLQVYFAVQEHEKL